MEAWMQDVPHAVAQAQRDLRRRVADHAERFATLTAALRDEVASVRAEQSAGGAVPELAFDDIAAGRVPAAATARIKRRGCVVIRGVFDAHQVHEWNEQIVRYIDANHYLEHAKEAGSDKPAYPSIFMRGATSLAGHLQPRSG